jgi:8-oxo-dGTP pyrophosphatase MutT (NUDIX family)
MGYQKRLSNMDKLVPNGDEVVVYEGKIFEVVKQSFKAGDKEIVFETARRPPGTRIIIIKDRRILLTKEFRTEHNDYDYRLPGGKVFNTLEEYRKALKDKNDILPFAIGAAKKECLEETGIVANNLKYFQTAKAGATVEWDLLYFVVKDFKENKKQKLETGEVIFPEWKTFEEVKELCLKNKIREDRTVGVLLKFLLINDKQ